MTERLKNCALLTGTLIFLFAVLELAARSVLPPVSRANYTVVPKTIKRPSQVPGIRYLLQEDGTATQEFGTDPFGYFDAGATLSYRINSSGFRGAAVPREKPPGTFRVIGLGDSFTFGSGVRNEHTFLSVLEDELNGQAAEGSFEVLNFGAPGYGTVDEVNLLAFRGLEFQPDLVIICFFLNDARGGGTATGLNPSSQNQAQPAWRRASRLLDFVTFRLEQRRGARSLARRYRESVEDDARGWVHAKAALKHASQLSQENHFELVLMIFPVLWQLSEEYPFADVHAKVGDFARSQSIPVLDLLPAFDGFDGPELWVHPNNQHPNRAAHEIAGHALARLIAAEGWLTPR